MSWLMGYMEGQDPELHSFATVFRIIVLLVIIIAWCIWK